MIDENDAITVEDVVSLKPDLDSARLAWWLYLVLMDPLLLLADQNIQHLQLIIQSMRSPDRPAAMAAIVALLQPYIALYQV